MDDGSSSLGPDLLGAAAGSVGGAKRFQASVRLHRRFQRAVRIPRCRNRYNGLLAKPEEFAKQVEVFYISMGSKEGVGTSRSIREALEQAGVKHVYYEAPGTGHKFQTWRKSLHGFAQLLFKD